MLGGRLPGCHTACIKRRESADPGSPSILLLVVLNVSRAQHLRLHDAAEKQCIIRAQVHPPKNIGMMST